jgi:hypothetical protein
MKGKGKRDRWTAVSVAIAAIGLVAALVFNGLQVRDSAEAQRQAKSATELGLLTQLQGVMSESLYSRVPYKEQFRRLRAGLPGRLTPAAYRVMVEEASNMDYFAWLFNEGYLTAPGADELWGPRMICEFKQVFAPGFENPAREVPDLYRFIQERPRLLQLAGRCE